MERPGRTHAATAHVKELHLPPELDLDRARRVANDARETALPPKARALVETMAALIDALVAELERTRAATNNPTA